MRTTIDKAGRVVIPQAIRDLLQLTAGQEIEVRERDGRVEIEPAPLALRLEQGDHGLVAIPEGAPPPPLTDEVVRQTLERTRR